MSKPQWNIGYADREFAREHDNPILAVVAADTKDEAEKVAAANGVDSRGAGLWAWPKPAVPAPCVNLKPFCFNESDYTEDQPKWNQQRLEQLGTPFSQGAFTYATNGKVMIRVPRRADVPERADAPDNVGYEIFDAMPHDGNWLPLTAIPEPMAHAPQQLLKVQIGSVFVDATFLRLIKDLPDVKVAGGVREDGEHFPAVAFSFDGGDGRIMPLRVDADDEQPARIVNLLWKNESGEPGLKSQIETPHAFRLIEKLLNEGIKSITIEQ